MISAAENLRVVVQKQRRALLLYVEDRLERTYPVALGRNWAADKAIEGDEATPVGEFYICAKNPRSKYFRSLCISYPNAEDAERGRAAGLITAEEHAEILAAIRLHKMPPQRTRLGGEIYIHGHERTQPNGKSKDWTRGCIALDNLAMQELYDRATIGTPVFISI
ncbi:MAG: L,D-transpeptidase family protein [Steroidobacteraceae bacterium]